MTKACTANLACRTCLESITFRTGSSCNNRSIVAYGPECDYIRLDGCELGGNNGLLLPLNKGVSMPVCTFTCLVCLHYASNVGILCQISTTDGVSS